MARIHLNDGAQQVVHHFLVIPIVAVDRARVALDVDVFEIVAARELDRRGAVRFHDRMRHTVGRKARERRLHRAPLGFGAIDFLERLPVPGGVPALDCIAGEPDAGGAIDHRIARYGVTRAGALAEIDLVDRYSALRIVDRIIGLREGEIIDRKIIQIPLVRQHGVRRKMIWKTRCRSARGRRPGACARCSSSPAWD